MTFRFICGNVNMYIHFAIGFGASRRAIPFVSSGSFEPTGGSRSRHRASLATAIVNRLSWSSSTGRSDRSRSANTGKTRAGCRMSPLPRFHIGATFRAPARADAGRPSPPPRRTVEKASIRISVITGKQFGMTNSISAPTVGTRISAPVKWYDPVKGYGFLVHGNGLPDIFAGNRH